MAPTKQKSAKTNKARISINALIAKKRHSEFWGLRFRWRRERHGPVCAERRCEDFGRNLWRDLKMNVDLDNTLLGCGDGAVGDLSSKRKRRLSLSVLAAFLALGVAGQAQAGSGGAPLDCVILLCMGGGFPANPECNAAKAEVVRRITPNPHSEPPLQVWNCPMGASFSPMTGPVPPAKVL